MHRRYKLNIWNIDSDTKQGWNCSVNEDRVYFETSGDRQVIVLCDGASCCKHSAAGAELLSRTAGRFLIREMDRLVRLGHREIQQAVFEEGMNAIEEYAAEHHSLPEDYACTLLALCIDHKKKEYISLHLGDGMILCRCDRPYVLSKPANGIHRYETYLFLKKNMNRIRVRIGNLDSVRSFMLVTDGMYENCYSYGNETAEKLAHIKQLDPAADDQTYIRITAS